MPSFNFLSLQFLLLLLKFRLIRSEYSPIPCTDFSTCTSGFFCNLDNSHSGFCQSCVDSDACKGLTLSEAGAKNCVSSCKTCSDVGTDCSQGSFCKFVNGSSGFCFAEELRKTCSKLSPCANGYFCDFESQVGDRLEGLCRICSIGNDCFRQGLPEHGVASCTESCSDQCFSGLYSKMFVNGTFFSNNVDMSYCANPKNNDVISTEKCTNAMPTGRYYLHASGQLVNCGLGLQNCADADGAICLIQRGKNSILEKLQACENENGVGAIIYNNETSNFMQWPEENTTIPSVSISGEGGGILLNHFLGVPVEIMIWDYAYANVTDVNECRCSENISCANGQFCNYNYDAYGYCENCANSSQKEIAMHCLFSGLPQKGAKSCADKCDVESISCPTCKFCPKEISVDNFHLGGRPNCDFCPNDDMKYPDRNIRMYGDIPCWNIYRFYNDYQIDSDSTNCKIAHSMNYVCGCTGAGYLGANSERKKALLAWLPRVSASLSIMGSSYIIIDVCRNKELRITLNQLLVALSVFDLIGSIAYAFTTLPIYQEDFVYGALGNKQTCIAQGYFIQIGTISALLNVSLSMYYLGRLKYSWSRHEMKKIKIFLFAVPILVGLVFAGAGIPFYDNMFLWCNNSAKWWPEIPIILALIAASTIMFTLYRHVSKEEKVMIMYRRGSINSLDSMSNSVMWESAWYLLSFYCTWTPYLVLQYLWASEEAYFAYNLATVAGTLVPLQGFWNFCNYMRKKMKLIGYDVIYEMNLSIKSFSEMNWSRKDKN